VPVEDLEQPVVPNLLQLLAGDRPSEVRMVDMRNALCLPDRIDVALQHVGDRSTALRRNAAAHVKAVDVQRLAAERIGDLLALDHQELLLDAEQPVQGVDRCEHVVIGEDDELISVLAVPFRDVVRRRIAVAVDGVGVGVALVPAPAGRRGRWLRGLCGGGRGEPHPA
jgi:hypothetical protein